MKRYNTFLAAGGDMRQIFAAKALLSGRLGFTLGFEELPDCPLPQWRGETVDFALLPIPASEDGVIIRSMHGEDVRLTQIAAAVREGGIVFGGKISDEVRDFFSERSIDCIDYLKREETAIKNAVPTAEGAIKIAMEELPTTVYGSKILLIGMGRIAKAMIRPLLGLGAEVTAAARKVSDRAWAEVFGCKSESTERLCDILPRYDVIFNTAPARLLGERELLRVRPNGLIIDLASAPGGVDMSAAARLGVNVIHALSLPGRYFPVTAGEIIAETVKNILGERSEGYEP